MKQILVLVLLGLAGFGIYRYLRGQGETTTGDINALEFDNTSPSPAPTTLPEKVKTVNFNEETYAYEVIKAIVPAQVKLIPNYEKQARTEEMQQVEKCSEIVSGGFYGTDNKPLGWVVEKGKEISRQKSSLLFNGFVFIDEELKVNITLIKPESNVVYGLQTGPILFMEKKPLKLSMARDKNARRMVLAVDTDGNMNFFAFYVKDGIQSGPMLVDLPAFVSKASAQENIELESAVNLDGGNASAFFGSKLRLEEITPVGSWWCINPV